MKRQGFLIVLILLSLAYSAQGQERSLSGNVTDSKGSALPYATAVLLHPTDSTMEYYGITNKDGWFEIRNVRPGAYLLQVAFMGYTTLYRDLRMPESRNNFV